MTMTNDDEHFARNAHGSPCEIQRGALSYNVKRLYKAPHKQARVVHGNGLTLLVWCNWFSATPRDNGVLKTFSCSPPRDNEVLGVFIVDYGITA